MKALLVSTDQSVHVYTFLMNILENRSVVLQNLFFFFAIAQTDRQVFRSIRTIRQIWSCLRNIQNQNSMVTIFVLKKCIHTGNHTLNRPSHVSLLSGKKNGFTTNDGQEKTFSLKYLVDFVQFLPWTNCVFGSFEDCPVSDKIIKIMANYSYLLSIADDRRCV